MDTRSHSGGFMTMVTRGAYVHSRKQNPNSNSSIEANIVGVDDVRTQITWNRYFLKEQGYKIHDNIIYKVNQSSIKPEKNGRQSRSKRTSQIYIIYYFVTDRIAKL